MKPRILFLVGMLAAAILSLPIIGHFNAVANETAKKARIEKIEPVYHLVVFGVKIAVAGDQLAVNQQKCDGKTTVKIAVDKTEKMLKIRLNKKGVLSVDDGKNFPLLVYASKKPLPTPSGTEIKVDGKTVYVGKWFDTDCGRVRKFSFQIKKSWTVQVSQMSDQKGVSAEFKDAIRTLRYGGTR